MTPYQEVTTMTDLAYWGRIEFLITFLAIYTIVFVGVQYANPSWVFRKAGRPIQWGMVAIWAAFFLVMAGMCIALSNTAYPPRNIFGWLAVVAYSAIGAVSVGFA